MKKIMILVFTLLMVPATQAATLVCASMKDETLYYQDGQLVLSAVATEPSVLQSAELSFLPARRLGTSETDIQGQQKGGWIRFQLSGDAWCSYKVALPADFLEQSRAFTAFVDAVCEENSNSTIRLSCRLR